MNIRANSRIGFIGLGAMGAGMTRNLIANGFEVSGYDVSPARIAALEQPGFTAVTSPAAAAQGAASLAVCVFEEEQACDVLFGDTSGRTAAGAAPALEGLGEGATVLMHTTMSAESVSSIQSRLAVAGVGLVDAPVTGGKTGADEGRLTVIVSGSPGLLDTARPVFEAVGRRIYAVGDAPGAASTVKMINQLLVGVHTAAAAEAMTLAVKAGADPEAVYDVITHGGGNSVSFKTRVPYFLERDFAPRGVVDIFTKDLGIVREAAERLGVPAPLSETALAQFQAAHDLGYGEEDDAAVIRIYERAAGVTVRRQEEVR